MLHSYADNELHSCSIYLDISKAFDTLNHKILLDKFHHKFDIAGIPIQLFRSYLPYCKQFTKLQNLQCTLVNPSSGEPQASVLGPLIFIMCK